MSEIVEIEIVAISNPDKNGWREAFDEQGNTYKLSPTKWPEEVLNKAKQERKITGNVSEKDGVTYIWPPDSGGKKSSGGGGFKQPALEHQKYPGFAISYAKDIVQSLIETQVVQQAAKEKNTPVSGLVAGALESYSDVMFNKMIDLRKKADEQFGK